MQHDHPLEEHAGRLREAADAVHAARASFLAEAFDGYVADTYHVRGVGYVCWPAVADDGRFEAYDDLCPGERAAVDSLVDEGFGLLAVGLTSVVLLPPDDGDHVVKLGRCGMGGGFGDGRRANLVEASLTESAGEEAPVVPSVHCSGRGEFAVYPRVEHTGAAVEAVEEYDGSKDAIRDWLAAHAPWVDVAEALAPENRCVWRGRLRTLDYSHPDAEEPLGVPDHVDRRRVREAVDERRRAGEKRDLADGGGFLEPDA